jgi:hypothetical protein
VSLCPSGRSTLLCSRANLPARWRHPQRRSDTEFSVPIYRWYPQPSTRLMATSPALTTIPACMPCPLVLHALLDSGISDTLGRVGARVKQIIIPLQTPHYPAPSESNPPQIENHQRRHAAENPLQGGSNLRPKPVAPAIPHCVCGKKGKRGKVKGRGGWSRSSGEPLSRETDKIEGMRFKV